MNPQLLMMARHEEVQAEIHVIFQENEAVQSVPDTLST